MKKTILATLLAGLCLPAFANQYYVVVPVPNRTPTAGNILVTLSGYSLPAGVVGRAYSGFNFNAALRVQGDPSYSPANVHWSVAGGALPAGLSLGADGKLSGTPTSAGSSSFQVMASYKTKAGEQAYQILVADVTVSLSGAALPDAEQGAAYSYDFKSRLTVSGDTQFNPAQVTWSTVGALPPGLSLNSDGTLTGVPTGEGTYPFTVKASYLSRTGQHDYQVIVGAITVVLASSTPPAATLGQAYNNGSGWDLKPNLTVSGDAAYAGNAAGVTWSVTGGALPAGLTLNSDGMVTGTPTGSGANPVQVTAAYKSKSAAQSYAIPFTGGIAQYSGYRAWSDGSLAQNCLEYRNGKPGFAYSGATGDGVYRIDVDGAGALTPVDVKCDMTTAGGGWTVFQRRVDSSVDFYRTYAQYAAGFGSATTDYWMGNDRLAVLTANGAHNLRIDMTRYTGDTSYATYTGFSISPASDGYRIGVTWAGGPAGDSLTSQNGMKFTTYDVDQDSSSGNCAVQYHGAWWYTACHLSNLNGAYLNGPHTSYADGMEWNTWTGYYESLTKTEMKVR
ncbi:fibrinogen-related protein [Paraburkholderia sp. A3RO-2L]|uniref:fibrinogen-related protein n=1 Tax=Paraburkholderia sp. A3RO-2L TaxID=3028376 RepID=UPI003DA7E8AC